MNMRFYRQGQDWLHWNIILGLLCVTLIVGTVAVFTAFPRPPEQATILWLFNNTYRIVALFAIDQSSLEATGSNSIGLGIAKFLGFMTVLFSLGQLFFQFLFRHLTLEWMRRYSNNHIVIAGFGECGRQLAQDILQHGRSTQILAIDHNPDDAQQEFVANNAHITLISGEIGDPDALALHRVAAQRAHQVFFTSDNDLDNIQGTRTLRNLLVQHPRPGRPVTAYVHVRSPSLLQQLKAYPQFVRDEPQIGLQVRMFNSLQLAARQLILSWPLYRYADMRGQDRVHLVILGLTPIAEQLIVQALTQFHYKDFAPPMVTVLDVDAERRGNEFRERYPVLHENNWGLNCPFGSLEFVNCNVLTDNLTLGIANSADNSLLANLELQAAIAGTNNLGQAPRLQDLTRGTVTAVAVCFDDDHAGLTAALRFRTLSKRTRLAQAPIFVWCTHDILPDIFRSVASTPDLNEVLQPFGTVESTCTITEIVDANSDKLPKILHDSFTALYPDAPQAKTWEELSEEYRDSNRSSADHLGVKLASAGYYWSGQDVFHWSPAVKLCTVQLKPSLAELEHRRWLAERMLNDWTLGNPRDDDRKLHPDIQSWPGLTTDNQRKNLDSIRTIEQFFSVEPSLTANLTEIMTKLRARIWLKRSKLPLVRPLLSLGVLVPDLQLHGVEQYKQLAIQALQQLLNQHSEHHVQLCSPLDTADEVYLTTILWEYLQQQQRVAHLLLAETSAFMHTTDTKADWLKARQQLAGQAQWLIDLLPPAQGPRNLLGTSLEAKNLGQLQRQRGWAYAVERNDWLLLVGNAAATQDIRAWRAGKTAVPSAYTSIPANLRASRPVPTAGFWWDTVTDTAQPLQ